MKKIVKTALFVIIAIQVMSQDTARVKPASLAFKFSVLDFKKTNLTEGLSKTAPSIGVQYFKGITKRIDFMTNLDLASIKYPFYTSLNIPKATSNELYAALDFNLNFKLLTDNHKVVPYVSTGIGVGYVGASYFTAYAPMGLGLQIKANHGSFVHLLSTYRAEASSPLTKMHFSHAISYSFPIKGKNKKAIELPQAPISADNDGDGVVDSLDQCPTQSGTIKYKGCPVPDTDNDGVNDENDQCPTKEGTIKYKGCPVPDVDKDGINDESDKCPKVAGLSRYDGCPIPDTDKDGVNDEQDKCPTVAGIAANNGCADLQVIFDQVSAQLKFSTGKAVLSSKLATTLNTVVASMNEFPNVTLNIGGHTDNTGTEKINLKLSKQRAAVVAKYLLKKGIASSRIIQQGYAATKPIADNKTKAGRAKNRRVEIEVKY